MNAGRFAIAAAVTAACVLLSCSTSAEDNTATIPECGGDIPGFEQREAQGSGLHYAIGGSGPAVVLLHGFPETWWTWRLVMPALAQSHTVIAPDLRGVGCSPIEPARYDADSLALDVRNLVRTLNISSVAVVGHDLGGWVAYAYARQFRDEVTHLVLSGAVIPGFGLERLLDFREPGQGLPHLALFSQPQVPELLIEGREKQYFDAFIDSAAMKRSGAAEYYAQTYARPGRLTAALGQYRAMYADADANRRGRGPPLTMPTMALGGTGQTGETAESLRQVAAEVGEVAIPGGGHYVQEEKPDEMARALDGFL